MKDFVKTNEFVQHFNWFVEVLLNKSHTILDGRLRDGYIANMQKCCDATSLKGEDLANEVIDICTDMERMQYYFEKWEERLDGIILRPDEETTFKKWEDWTSAMYWSNLINDDETSLQLACLAQNFIDNYNDVMEGRKYLIKTHNLRTEEDKLIEEDLQKFFEDDLNERHDSLLDTTEDVPQFIISYFKNTEACRKFFECDEVLSGANWGRRFKYYKKSNLDHGAKKNLFKFLQSLHNEIKDCEYSAFQKKSL
ncbi:MAG: hypothetical protein J5965_22970 [Aeriscardovia sp.]|nr:hypothetical protein [Aeriscardovia sp.]